MPSPIVGPSYDGCAQNPRKIVAGRDLTSALRVLSGVQMTADQESFGGAYGFRGGTGAIQGTRDTQQNLMVDGIVANDMGLPSGLSGQEAWS